jgi:beta-lactamase regulating signal transducer with metallopeptidase domain
MMDMPMVWLGERLFVASTQGAVVIALVWLLCRTMRGLPAAAHATLWWLAALKLLLAFTPVPAIELQLLPAAVASLVDATPNAVASAAIGQTSSEGDAVSLAGDGVASSAVAPEVNGEAGVQSASRETVPPAESGLVPGWRSIALWLWLAFVAAHAVRLLREYIVLRRIVHRAPAWPDEHAGELTTLVARIGLHAIPRVRLSDEIDGPQVSGVWRPTVLLPASVMALHRDERTMALCHELMHIRRRDLVMGWVPALAERLFFFHPLARLAAREYVVAREAACDAAVVRTLGVAPDHYGQLLVRLGVSTTQPMFAAGGAPLSKSSLRRRLEMLQHIELSGRGYWRWVAVAALLALIPLQLVARTTESQPPPVEEFQAAAPAGSAPSSPAAAPESRPEPQVVPVEREPQRTNRTPQLVTPEALLAIERSLAELRRVTEDTAAQEQLRNGVAELERAFAQQAATERTQSEAASSRAVREQMFALIESMGAQRGTVNTAEVIDRWLQLERNARSSADLSDSLREHMDQLRVQQDMLARQLQQIWEQQEKLSEAQRHLTDQTEQIRKALEAR